MHVSMRVPLAVPGALAGVVDGARLERWPMSTRRDKFANVWVSITVPNAQAALNRALRILDGLNATLMIDATRRGVTVPSAYDLAARGLLRYKAESMGREWWQTFVDNFAERAGDCEDLASHTAQHNRLFRGLNCWSECVRSSPTVYHAIVRHSDGSIEDPSMPLGLWRIRDDRDRAFAEERNREEARP